MVRTHHCQFEGKDRPFHERVQANPDSDSYVFTEIADEKCIFCKRRRVTKIVTTVKYTPKRLEYDFGEVPQPTEA